MKTDTTFEAAFELFLNGCKEMTKANWRVDRLQKRIRIARADSADYFSAHCFVDIESGDVLKAASWKAPAKHARGNIYDDYNGLRFMGQFGPASLR